ncbi:pyridoxal phosphate-dependent transferase [Mycena crocata]|nr:pyridoxal phosphate-dependent transferase [Mycena crocata]
MALYQHLPPAPGQGVPPHTPHSLCTYLPEWHQNVQVATGDVLELLKDAKSSYTRNWPFPYPWRVCLLALALSTGNEQEKCLLFPTHMLAEECRSFIKTHVPSSSCEVHRATKIANAPSPHEIFAVSFSTEEWRVMKFYTFSGGGISPRLAELCLRRLAGDLSPTLSLPESIENPLTQYYQNNLPLNSSTEAKVLIRSRVAGIIEGVNIRGVDGASPDDVYLFASGMQAIWRVYKLLAATIGTRISFEGHKVAHMNLVFCDSYKFLELPDSAGYHFFTNDTITELEELLATGTPNCPAILALFTDFPGNAHLVSADLKRLRGLADRYNFPLVIDETIGGYLNTQIFPYCDVVVSSLTKLFSGMANVMAGGLMLNPTSRFYPEFKAHMEATYEDSLFDSDAIVLEMNSRELVARTATSNRNSEALADMLYPCSVVGGHEGSIIQAVHYPKYRTRDNYEQCHNPLSTQVGLEAPGYGSLLSVTFTSATAVKAFYSALQCYKGSTLGTVFTLATAFSVLAYPPNKMDWIKEHGVEENLVRFSVGTEDPTQILKCVTSALLVAEEATRRATDPGQEIMENQDGYEVVRRDG